MGNPPSLRGAAPNSTQATASWPSVPQPSQRSALNTAHVPQCSADKLLPATVAKRVHIYQSPVSGTYDAVNSIWRGSLAGQEGSALH